MKEVVIFGTGGHAKVVFDILINQKTFKPVAFFSLNEDLKEFNGLPHFHQKQLAQHNFSSGVIAIGDNSIRSQVVSYILQSNPQFSFITAIHPMASISADVVVGAGSVVMSGCNVNPGTKIGDHTIINTGANIDHDCSIENYASIAPGCNLGGNVRVGEYSAVSLGANVIHGQTIGKHTIVGAGSLVLKNIGDFKVAYGTPCAEIRSRVQGEKYL